MYFVLSKRAPLVSGVLCLLTKARRQGMSPGAELSSERDPTHPTHPKLLFPRCLSKRRG